MYISEVYRDRQPRPYIVDQLKNRIGQWIKESRKIINAHTYFQFYGLVDTFLREKIRDNELEDFKIICFVCYAHKHGIAYYKSDHGHYTTMWCKEKIPPRIFEIHIKNFILTVEF